MEKIAQLDKNVMDVLFIANKVFPKIPIRIWFAMIGDRAWRGIVINSDSKERLVDGPIRASPSGSLISLKVQLENLKYKAVK